MLTSRNIPRACQSCRLHLLSIFEHAFTSTATTNVLRTMHQGRTSIRPRLPRSQPRRNPSGRRLSTTRILAVDTQQSAEGADQSIAKEIEAVVRQARQTFGSTLPKDYLSVEEYVLYERLYGPPSRETKAEDLEYLPDDETGMEAGDDRPRNVLLRENGDGAFEEVDLDPELRLSASGEFREDTVVTGGAFEMGTEDLSMTSPGLQEKATTAQDGSEANTIQIQAKNQREFDAITRLQRDMNMAMARPADEEEDIEEESDEVLIDEEEELEDEEDFDEDLPGTYITANLARTHPHTMAGRFGPSPSTLSLPQGQFVQPITELLARTNFKHLAEAAEKAFGGKGLPHSASTPSSKKLLPQKHVGLDAGQHKMTEIEADVYIAGVMPATYASVMSSLVEVRKRLGTNWVRDLIFRDGGEGPRVLDAGSGGAGIVAWRQLVQAEWDVLKDDGIVEGADAPSGKTTVLTGSSTLRHRMSRFLDNTTFLPRLPDYVHAANSKEWLDGSGSQTQKSYDLIIAPHTLLHLKEDFRRKHMIQNLWSLLEPKGGVLLLIEKGLPRGFEAIAGARSLLLDTHISSPGDTSVENEIQAPSSDLSRFTRKEDGMIIAPCTNHTKCPMYPVPGLTSGRKDFCHFSQRYIRPPFLQRILGASSRNHEDVDFSYIAVRRGVDARKTDSSLIQGGAASDQSFAGYENHDLPEDENQSEVSDSEIKFHPFALPRAILPPLKRRGHVTLDLCTPSGKLERWTIPKSFSKVAYRDARKSKWGDLWALGAKTRTPRQPRLGSFRGDGAGKTVLKGVRDGRIGNGGKKMQKNRFDIIMGKEGMEGIQEARSQSKFLRPEKRTKGGRVWKEKKPIGEDDL